VHNDEAAGEAESETMRKRKTASALASEAKAPARDAQEGKRAPEKPVRRDGWREFVESVVIAFVGALVFRTYAAEPFVIPTGSMAPTLMGRHKDLDCPMCRFPYRVSASEEVDDDDTPLPGRELVWSVCPNCRYRVHYDPSGEVIDPRTGSDPPPGLGESHPSFKGDRIVVVKFPFALDDPARWDVAVFKYPESAQTNYIKRIVGVPDETVVIHHGDVFTLPLGDVPRDLPALEAYKREGKAQIQRKPVHKLEAMLQPVYDNDYVLPAMIDAGWPSRWWQAGESEPAQWQPRDNYKEFVFEPDGKGMHYLVYRHVVPPVDFDWSAMLEGRIASRDLARARPQLITDCYGYNTGYSETGHSDVDSLGLHWVGDLAVECELDVEGAQGKIALRLHEGGRVFMCSINVADGSAELTISGLDEYHPTAVTPVRGPGKHHLRFANVDDELLVWVDGDPVEFGDTTYPYLDNLVPEVRDLSPVGIGAEGVRVRAGRLRVLRDVYYIADKEQLAHDRPPRLMRGIITDYSARCPQALASGASLSEFLSAPPQWRDLDQLRFVAFHLEHDQYLLLGDNSPRSKDSRLWRPSEQFVHRDLLIGKAMFVLFPRALFHLRIPVLDWQMPVIPNFPRMGFIE
jgi:signal peptidase I